MNEPVVKPKGQAGTVAGPNKASLAGMLQRNLFSRGIFDEFFDHYLSETNPELSQLMSVSMDVAETDLAFEVKVDLPGINVDNVDIQIDNNTLTIRGHREMETEEQDETRKYHRVERYSGRFARSVVLPSAVNEEETAAEFKDGVLKIVVPKSESAKPRKINIAT